jgi:hypothetical protein
LRPACKIVHKNPISKITKAKWTAGVAQAQSPEFKPQSHQKKKRKKTVLS